MPDPSSAGTRSEAAAMTFFEAANAAATSAPVRTKLRREQMFFMGISAGGSHCCILDMRCPAVLILSPPQLHRLEVALDLSVFRVEMQLPVDFPRDVGKLQHRNGDVAHGDRS